MKKHTLAFGLMAALGFSTTALARLDERERLVLTLYYQHELSLKEIALVLEVSDARVCQLSKQAIGKACRFLGSVDP